MELHRARVKVSNTLLTHVKVENINRHIHQDLAKEMGKGIITSCANSIKEIDVPQEDCKEYELSVITITEEEVTFLRDLYKKVGKDLSEKDRKKLFKILT